MGQFNIRTIFKPQRSTKLQRAQPLRIVLPWPWRGSEVFKRRWDRIRKEICSTKHETTVSRRFPICWRKSRDFLMMAADPSQNHACATEPEIALKAAVVTSLLPFLSVSPSCLNFPLTDACWWILVTAGNLRDVCSFVCVSFVVGYFPDWLQLLHSLWC